MPGRGRLRGGSGRRSQVRLPPAAPGAGEGAGEEAEALQETPRAGPWEVTTDARNSWGTKGPCRVRRGWGWLRR